MLELNKGGYLMKNILYYLVFLICLASIARATEITNPFYISPKGKITSTTSLSYNKFHVKNLTNGFNDYRTRNRIAEQHFSYGISPKVAIEGSVLNNWKRKKFDDFGLTDKIDTNIKWSVGALYDLYNKDNAHFQLKLLYLQQMHHFAGAYKAFNAKAKTGYDFESFLPYLGGEIELPIAQRKNDDNNPKYDVYAGIYKNFNDVIAVDMNIHYNYDKMYKSKKMNGRTEINFFATPQIALSGFFDYTFFDKGKNNADADSHSIGGSIKVQF